MNRPQKINEFNDAIAWWQAALDSETSELQREAKEAIIRKLKYQRRKLIEAEQGLSLASVWEDIRDTTLETCDEWSGHFAESFNAFCENSLTFSPSSLADNKEVTTPEASDEPAATNPEKPNQ